MIPPLRPPASWFDRPDIRDDQRLVIEEDSGRLYGRWYSAHVPVLSHDGVTRVIGPSPTGYASLFHRGQVECEDGELLACGRLVAGHGADHPSAVVAVVRAGDDNGGGWLAGAFMPGLTRSDIAVLRRSDVSGAWTDMGERGFELHELTLVPVGAAVLIRVSAWGPSPALHRAELARLRRRERALRDGLRDAIDGNPPGVVVAAIRRVLDKHDDDDLQRAIDDLMVDDPARRLPPERIPDPLPSKARGR